MADLASDPRHVLLGTSVALCLGALVGLERQVAEEESGGVKDFPGVRTFAFTALLGALAVLVAQPLGPWMGIAIFLASSSFLVMRYRYDVAKRDDPGFTTEVAALCTFAVGALAQAHELLVGTIITIAMVVMLRSKRTLHKAGRLLSTEDMEVLIRFLVITGIVLPLLPDEPLDFLNGVLRPRDVWRMVVLISGMSFAGYVLMRFWRGPGAQLITGLLAGLISGTAAMLSYARASRENESRHYESMASLSACTSFLRMLIVIAAVAPVLLPRVWGPLTAMSAVALLYALLRFDPNDTSTNGMPIANPLALRPALGFAGVYASVLCLVALTREWLGESAMYATSALAASVGSDAPTLSLARLVADGRLDVDAAARGILLVAIASVIAKSVIAASQGRRSFALRVTPGLLATAASGAAYAVWYFQLLG